MTVRLHGKIEAGINKGYKYMFLSCGIFLPVRVNRAF